MPDSRLVPRPEDRPVATTARPILWQVRQDLTAFSNAQVIPALVMGIGTFVTAWALGQITSWPSALVLVFGSVIVGVILYAVLAIVRAPFIVIAQHHRQLSDVSQRLFETESRLIDISTLKTLSAAQPLPKPEPPPEPNIVYQSSDVVIVHRQHRGFLGQGKFYDHNRHSVHFPALVATYRNKILKEREIGGRGQISAQLSFIAYEGSGSLITNRAVWLGTNDFRIVFGINDPHSLVVAIAENGLCAIQENTTDDYENPTKTIRLTGRLHRVKIELFSEFESKRVATNEFMLEVKWEPELDMRLEHVPLWKDGKLNEMVQAGRALMERHDAGESDETLEPEFEKWESLAAQFIARHLGESFTERFRPAPYVPPPGSRFAGLGKALEPAGVYNKTRAKVEALERFRNEAI